MGPNDCRITTHYDEQFFNSAFFGILHESGHAIYEQGLPTRAFRAAAGRGRLAGHSRVAIAAVGESGRPQPGVLDALLSQAQQCFPAALGDVPFDAFHFAINDVRPSLIRIEADEATYNLHILIRFELERALLDDELRAADLPEAWNEKYQQYLGITPPDNRSGVLQDVHWSAGLIGYFPTYSLGNLYAAQFFGQAEADLGNLGRIVCPG